jgi:hypothetical protein
MVMNKKKIILISSVIVLALGGFLLTKYLTRNVVRKKYITIKYIEYPTEEVTTTDNDN